MLRIITVYLSILFISGNIFSQTPGTSYPSNNYSSDFVPNQILIKFKDDLATSLQKINGMAGVGNTSVDKILQKYKAVKVNKLFPDEKKLLQKRMLKKADGSEFEEPSLHNIYKIEVDSIQKVNIFQVIDELKNDPNVIYAEPNYILSVVEAQSVSPEMTEAEVEKWLKEHPEIKLSGNDAPQTRSQSDIAPNDPLYSQQWYINSVQADSVWKQSTGDTTQIIAILDTGVDWLHPDLINKIWINPNEIPGNGIDDDNDGLIDDVRGWDWINNDNNPMDDNSHGTHVAGIAAAEANNGIGIAGISWKAKVMALKVFQSSGRGDVATISEGINYAKNKGATIINMSFGSYARSFTMENALANAYPKAVLVAAAGNDGLCIGPGLCPDLRVGRPFYPASFSYVFGVEATSRPPLGFSNYDQDGPVYSGYSDLLNYEMIAPGTDIISTVPNGRYKIFSGTSMAAPILSGGISLYKSIKSDMSQEIMWGNFINTLDGCVKLKSAIDIKPEPVLSFVNYVIRDTLDGDKDGRLDAGETIDLWFKVRNTWGQSDSVFVGIGFGEYEDTTLAQIIKKVSFIGSISPYASRTNEFQPLRLKLNSNIQNGRDIIFEGRLWYKGARDTVKQKIILTVEKGVELKGIINNSMTLTPDKLYLVPENVIINSGVTLTIKPGTKILIYPDKAITCLGNLNAIGNKDSLITFSSSADRWDKILFDGPSLGIFDYCLFELSNSQYGVISQPFTSSSEVRITNSIFRNNSNYRVSELYGYYKRYIERSNFYYNNVVEGAIDVLPLADLQSLRYSNIISNRSEYDPSWSTGGININNYTGTLDIAQNNIFNNSAKGIKSNILSQGNYYFKVYNIPPNYYGSSDSLRIANSIFDYFDKSTLMPLDFSNYRNVPSDSCHGIVWKVLVNGKDAQDQVVDPVGVGPQRFDIYFNRPMDKNYPPQISFGVRPPFTQQAVSDSGRWSEDGKIYTAYKTVKLYTGDGINKVRVSGARDLDNFEIPVEDMRFEFLVDVAGSSSADFMAAAGLGKVNLEWNRPPEVPDLLGFNIYRFENITDTTFTKPTIVNSYLVNDTLYTDFKVTPNKKYYYYYKVVRTDFSESDSSRIVSSIPFTASKGDANGDLKVDVLDITSEVSYLLNQNPQPFIFEAADANGDGSVNVLDIVKIVNLIMGSGTPAKNSISKPMAETAPELVFDSKSVSVRNGKDISALEFKIACSNIKDAQIIPGENVSGMEISYAKNNDTLTVLIFSYKNNNLPNDKGILFKINNAQFTKLINVTAGNSSGEQLKVKYANDGFIIPKDYALYQNYPNPFNPATTIRYALPKNEDIEISIFNILGQRVWSYELKAQDPGYHEIVWNGKTNNNSQVSSGVYIYQIRAGKFVSQKKMLMLK